MEGERGLESEYDKVHCQAIWKKGYLKINPQRLMSNIPEVHS
jgi:hypothetical protein